MDKSNEIIRILHIFGALNTGGAETLIMNIYRNIDRKKYQFDFVVHGDERGFYESEILKLGGKIYRVSKYKGINHFIYKKQWRNFFNAHTEYMIVHSHIRSTASIILKMAKEKNIKTICHSHSTSNGVGLSAIVKKLLQSRIPKYADYLLACSFDSAKWLYGEELAKSNRCIIINNSIDASKYIFDDKKRNIVRKKFDLDNKIVLGQVGRLFESKNYVFTIELLSELIKKNINYHLLIIGSGPLKEKLICKIHYLNIDKYVTFLENRPDVNELMQAMDIFLMPSLWEGLPLALVEAQAASLPCIISNNVRDGILINNKVYSLNINSTEEWINTIELLTNKEELRKDESIIIKKSGFDVRDNTLILCDFYSSIIRGN